DGAANFGAETFINDGNGGVFYKSGRSAPVQAYTWPRMAVSGFTPATGTAGTVAGQLNIAFTDFGTNTNSFDRTMFDRLQPTTETAAIKGLTFSTRSNVAGAGQIDLTSAGSLGA